MASRLVKLGAFEAEMDIGKYGEMGLRNRKNRPDALGIFPFEMYFK